MAVRQALYETLPRIPSKPSSGGDDSVLFERRRDFLIQDRWSFLFTAFFLALISTREMRRALESGSPLTAEALVPLVLGASLIAGYLLYALWLHRRPERQKLQLRISDEGIVSPQVWDPAPESIAFEDLVGVAWEGGDAICFEASGRPRYLVSMKFGGLAERHRRSVRRILSEHLPFFESKFETKSPDLSPALMRHELHLYWSVAAALIALLLLEFWRAL